MKKASILGLSFRNDVDVDGTEFKGAISNSFAEFLGGAYVLFSKELYRPIGAPPLIAGDASHTNVNETIDGSVFKRWQEDRYYRPRNLGAWIDSKGVVVSDLQGAVRADDPSVSVPD